MYSEIYLSNHLFMKYFFPIDIYIKTSCNINALDKIYKFIKSIILVTKSNYSIEIVDP